jgi:spore coat protein U-like protein
MDFARRGRFLLLAAALAGAAPAAISAGSTTLAVSATVLSKSNCRFTVKTGNTIPFGSVDPFSTATITITRTWELQCNGSANTASYVVKVGDGSGTRNMQHSTVPTALLPYGISASPSSGTVPKGATVSFTITGTLSSADYANARMGSYSDTVPVTLSP